MTIYIGILTPVPAGWKCRLADLDDGDWALPRPARTVQRLPRPSPPRPKCCSIIWRRAASAVQ